MKQADREKVAVPARDAEQLRAVLHLIEHPTPSDVRFRDQESPEALQFATADTAVRDFYQNLR